MSTHQYKRDISDKITTLATQFPAIVLTGARQTGKTTILRSLFPNHTYVSFDLPADAALAEDDPGNFLRRFPPPLIIEEVQYAPKLFRHLKVAIDLDREKNGLFILTGSQKLPILNETSGSYLILYPYVILTGSCEHAPCAAANPSIKRTSAKTLE